MQGPWQRPLRRLRGESRYRLRAIIRFRKGEEARFTDDLFRGVSIETFPSDRVEDQEVKNGRAPPMGDSSNDHAEAFQLKFILRRPRDKKFLIKSYRLRSSGLYKEGGCANEIRFEILALDCSAFDAPVK